MTQDNIRQFVLDALEHACPSIRDHTGLTAFLNETGDINFDAIEMDSLARMELCIYIEVNTGMELTPDQLDEIASLEGLAHALANR